MDQDLGNLWVVLNAAVYFFTFLLSLSLRNSLVSFILFLYAFSAFSSAILYNYGVNEWNITFIPFFYHYIVLIILLYPISKLNFNKIKINERPFNNFLVYLIIIMSFYFIIYSLFTINYDTALTSIGRIESVKQEGGTTNINMRFDLIFPLLGKFSSFLSAFFFFYFASYKKNNKHLVFLFLIIFISIPMIFFLKSNRSEGVFLFLSLGVAYCIFKEKYVFSKYIKFSLVCGFIGCVICFFIITLDRFSGLEKDYKVENSVVYSLFSYSGQGFLNFNDSIFENRNYSYGDITISNLRALLGKSYSKDLRSYENLWNLGRNPRVSMAVFSTLIGTFCMDYGPYWTFILAIFISIFMKRFFGKLSVNSLIIMYVYAGVLSYGPIMYKYYFFWGGMQVLFYFFIFIYLTAHAIHNKT